MVSELDACSQCGVEVAADPFAGRQMCVRCAARGSFRMHNRQRHQAILSGDERAAAYHEGVMRGIVRRGELR